MFSNQLSNYQFVIQRVIYIVTVFFTRCEENFLIYASHRGYEIKVAVGTQKVVSNFESIRFWENRAKVWNWGGWDVDYTGPGSCPVSPSCRSVHILPWVVRSYCGRSRSPYGKMLRPCWNLTQAIQPTATAFFLSLVESDSCQWTFLNTNAITLDYFMFPLDDVVQSEVHPVPYTPIHKANFHDIHLNVILLFPYHYFEWTLPKGFRTKFFLVCLVFLSRTQLIVNL